HLDVKVRPLFTLGKEQVSRKISLSSSAANTLHQTALSIEDSPLKDSLEKLSKRFKD
ncbi:MAG: hypothetical protein IMF04_02150, partial [Proteobacteria bacterium]|nr:hypothetical protein [Pseudomonadota bacterium]